MVSCIYRLQFDGHLLFCRTEIEWYPERCLTTIPIKKKPKSRLEDAKAITVTEDCDSFFSFFSALEIVDDVSWLCIL